MQLTLLERETIILFNEAEPTASVDTCNSTLIRQMDSYCAKSPCAVEVLATEHGKRYLVPKKWIKVLMPRVYTDEQRQKMSERARRQFNSKEMEGNANDNH